MSVAAIDLEPARYAQRRWAETPVRSRMRVLRRLRHEMASGARSLASSVPCSLGGVLRRTRADTLVSEVLPLIDACHYLERESAFVLAPRAEPDDARPLWLTGVSTETRREPLGVVLIIGPSNYPLFLPGVQVLQALAAGNAVLWKPAPGGESAAQALRLMLVSAGLEPALLTVLDATAASGQAAIAAGVDKVFLTGSATTGRAVMHALAETLTPSVMELSGCDAVFILEGADLARAVEAIVFGLRINGSATCMAPRRLFVASTVADAFAKKLTDALFALPAMPVAQPTRELARDLVDEATLYGASILVSGFEADSGLGPTLVTNATPDMRITQTDIFAPLLSMLPFGPVEEALAAHALCPYALTAAIFGPEQAADALAARLRTGVVVLNDVMVSTVDPRASFGGRGHSGFGVSRGREGLLEMTAVKTVVRQKNRSLIPYRPTTPAHGELFAAYIKAVHGGSLRTRWQGLSQLLRAARNIGVRPSGRES